MKSSNHYLDPIDISSQGLPSNNWMHLQVMTDNDAAEQLNSARDQLFKQFHERLKMKS